MTTFTTGGSAVTFTTSGSAVSFAVTPASNAFTTSAVLTPGAHASTHGAGGSDPITTLGTVAITSASGTATTLTVGTATINAGTATNLVLVTPTIGTATATGGTFTNANLVTPTIGTATMTGGTATTLTAAGEIHTGQATFAAGSAAGPSLAFTGDTNTGIYSPGADQVGIATAGTARVVVGDATNELTISNPATANYDFARSYFNVGSANRVAQLGYKINSGGIYSLYVANTSGTLTERFQVDQDGLIAGTGTSLGAWTSYTPTLGGTGWAIGDGTAVGAYCQIGKIVHFRVLITFGSTSTYGAVAPTLTLPVTAQSVTSGSEPHFLGSCVDSSLSTRYPIVGIMSGTTVISLRHLTSPIANVTSAVPMTWATGDYMTVCGTYQIA